ncbi:pantoate--beta-alanine ligase [Dethiobacter alkaliphilus]|uniref:Pantothenate synthetase n=1 Tax=Dethiobacter alkaliphilus AHT 1 TaxID=555088 RepID=C0GHQ1_DETAL|nr:pantoate--beta-alanine ligase [Dethiobacter alkaliphilus]EEG77257.1 pantoate/beta-alanine ligase [Dethiobacter alkaliphilus AHT 1]
MQIIRDIATLRRHVKQARESGKTVGFVPTMGYLHPGHLSLLHKAREKNDLIILSIFVNPLQFGAGEDYEEYPRDLEADAAQAKEAGCDLIFAPTVKEMYPQGYATFVDVERLTDSLCGASRPGHFRGVTTVVTKLFNIVTPDRAYFGQKDAQQALVLRKMARDLNMDLQVLIMPTIREKDGLAMSSRNTYLSPEERTQATVLSRSLFQAEEKIKNGERDTNKITEFITQTIQSEPLANIDYVAIVDTDEIKPTETINGQTLIALAVRFGKTRLIDNIIVEVS